MMSNYFTRGGQISLHSLRMLKQVFVSLGRWAFVLILLTVSYYCFLNVDSYQVMLMIWYVISVVYIAFGKPGAILSIHDSNSDPYTVSAYDFANSLTVLANKYYLISTIIEAFAIAGTITVILLVMVVAWFLRKGYKTGSDEEIRGNSLVDDKTLRKIIGSKNKKENYHAYTLGNIPYPVYGEALHTMIAGSTGSGKTVLISSLIDEIQNRKDRAIIYDKMGVYTERFFDPKKDILLNPFDLRSPKWSIFKEVKTDASFDSIAAALIPLEKSTTDPFWVKAARTLFSEVCSSLLKQGGVSNHELVSTLLKKNLAEAAALVKGTAAQAIIDEQSPKTALSVMSVLSTYLKCMKFLVDEGEEFSIREWILDEKKEGSIFITSAGDLHATLLPLISAWIEIAINNILSLDRSRNRKIWVVLDELPSLHSLPSLEQGLAETRQFGGCFVLSIQSISQLRGRYGMNGSQTISSLCSNKVFLRAGDYDSARWYSDNIGTVEIDELKEGLSYGAHEMRDGVSINRQRQIRALVLPVELINLKDREGYFCMAKGCPIAKSSFEYTDWKVKNAKLIEIKTANQVNAQMPLVEEEKIESKKVKKQEPEGNNEGEGDGNGNNGAGENTADKDNGSKGSADKPEEENETTDKIRKLF